MKCFQVTLALIVCAAVTLPAVSKKERERIREATTVLRELHNAPDSDIPQDLWEKAECVMVVPGIKKAAFIIGGEYGKGLMSCRQAGGWSAPIFMKVGKGSWGLQIGAQSIDLVLIVMNKSGAEKLLRNKTTLGAEASIAGGPVGRDARAATDVQMKSEILSYSRTQGLFAGVNLSGGVIEADDEDNQDLYGIDFKAREVLFGGTVQPPIETEQFVVALRR